MVLINYAGREINAKIVYYGPGLSGKTTNLECIYASVPANSRGKMVSMKTRQDRTLFFDFLPLELGEVHGFRTRFLLYTVPGQVFYNATRKLVLKGADAVVFVADSGLGKMEDNLESLRNLDENLREQGLSLDTVPFVIQYNKRDLPQAVPVAELEATLNTRRVPSFEAAAASGQGVYETLHAVSRLLFQRLMNDLRPQQAGRPNAGGASPSQSSLGRGTGPAPAPSRPAAPPSRGVPAAPVGAGGRAAQGPAGAGGRGHQPRATSHGVPEPAPRPGFIDPSVITMASPVAQSAVDAALPELDLDEPVVPSVFGTPAAGHVPQSPGPDRIVESVRSSAEALEEVEVGERTGEDYTSYGHVIDLGAGQKSEPIEGFIKDPLRRKDATPAAGGGVPTAAPAVTKRVTVVVSRADLEKAGGIRIHVDVRLES